jgi:hypothetical protein
MTRLSGGRQPGKTRLYAGASRRWRQEPSLAIPV